MKKIYSIIAGAALTLFAACSDTDGTFETLLPETSDELNVTLYIPDFEIETLNSRSSEMNAGYGATIYFFYFDGADKYTGYRTSSFPNTHTATYEYPVTLQNIPAGTKKVHVACSLTGDTFLATVIMTLQSGTPMSRLVDTWLSVNKYWTNVGPEACIVWGTASLIDITSQPGYRIDMLRNYARVAVENEAEGFTVESFGVFDTAVRGYLLPASGRAEVPTTPRVDSLEPYGYNMENKEPLEMKMKTTGYVHVFDTDKGHGRIIIKGSYKGKTGYYVAKFAKRTPGADTTSSDEHPSETPGNYTYQDIDIVRNHQYTLVVEYVRAEGWSTLAEALNAEPDNRMTVMIEDRNIDIKDIVACRDYALGVTDNELTVEGDATAVEFDIVSNYKSSEKPQPVLSDNDVDGVADCEWIDTDQATMTLQNGTYNMGTEGRSANGYCYHVWVPLSDYTDSENPRKGLIVVKTGDLERVITINQKPRDYIHENSRKVLMRIYSSTSVYNQVTDDYFAWVDQTDATNFCYGVRPEDNRGAIRNDGFIFPPFAGFYSYRIEYWIPYITGDQYETPAGYTADTGSSNTYNGVRYTRVYQSSNPSEVTTAKIISLKTNYGYGETIVYPVYQTGFFHELTDAMRQYQVGAYDGDYSKVRTGWYYYELAKVENSALGSNYYILDRNIGATTNAPYISTYNGYRNNSGAVGGFFLATTNRFSTSDYSGNYWERFDYSTSGTANDMAQKLGLTRLHTPTLYETLQWNVVMGRPSTGVSGNASYVAAVNTKGTNMTDSKVFIPHGGYYETNYLQLATRANIWTSSVYCQAQGFHPNQSSFPNQNFGYWFYYLDAQPIEDHSSDYNQIRCTDATGNVFSSNELYRYMPLRLAFVYNGSTSGSATLATPSGWTPEGSAGNGNSGDDNTANKQFNVGDEVTIEWGNHYYSNSADHYYSEIYVYYASGSKTPFGAFQSDDGKTNAGTSKVTNSKTFTVESAVTTLHIILHNRSYTNNNNNDEMKYDATTTTVKYTAGNYGSKDPKSVVVTKTDANGKKYYKVTLW